MKKIGLALLAVVLGASVLPALAAPAQQQWVEGTNYTLLEQPQTPTVPADKVEVMEIFSYACPFCDKFQPIVQQMQHSLPHYAQMVYLPASFNPAEDWPVFQQAFFAAQSLGIAERTHQAMYDAVWKNGVLATVDPNTNELKRPAPSLEAIAHYYSQLTGVDPEKFLTAARSFGVATEMRQADAQVQAMQVPGTPCIVVDGKWRVEMDSLRTPEDVVSVVNFLVAKAHSQHQHQAARPSA
jgi:protein dithiol oxidoreductase (disulfide-forming)